MSRHNLSPACDDITQRVGSQQAAGPVIVLMSTYNGERFLQQQLESIFRQSRPVDQVIIADDGSTDGTRELIQAYIGTHGLKGSWQLQVREENLGWRRSFFELLCAVKNERAVVLFSDQDDMWLPDRVEKTLHIMEAHPELLCLGCRWQPFSADGAAPAMAAPHGTGRVYCPQSYFDIHAGEAQSGCLLACRGVLLELIRQNTAAMELTGRLPPYDMYLSRYAFFLGGYYAVDEVWHLHRFHSSNATANLQAAEAPKGQGKAVERRAFCQEDREVLLGLRRLVGERHLETEALQKAIAWNEARISFMASGSFPSWWQALCLCRGKRQGLFQVVGDLCYRLGIQKIAGRLLKFFVHH